MTGTLSIDRNARYRGLAIALLLAFAAAFSYYLLVARTADPDTFWHIATGRYIVEHRAIPTTDVFSWYGVEQGLSWTPQSWLSGVFAYAGWALGGFPLLYIITALLSAGISGLVYWLFARRSGNRMLALFVAALTAFGISPSLAPRPHMLTYVLLLVLTLLLEHERWWWAVPVMLLGVNVHGPTYPMYLAVIAYYTLPKRWPVLVASTAITLATPVGLSLLPYPFLSLPGSEAPVIQEFMPVAPLQWPAYLIALLLILFLLDRQRMRLRDVAGMILLLMLSMAAARHMVFMYVLLLPLVAPYLGLPLRSAREREAIPDEEAPVAVDIDPSGSWVPRDPASGPESPITPLRLLDWVLVATLAIGSLVIAVEAARQPVDPFRDYPEQASQYLRSLGITRYLNEWVDGGFLIFRDMAPLVDGRGEQYFPYPGRRRVTLGSEYAAVIGLKVDCRPFLARNEITHLLLKRSSKLSRVTEQSPAFSEVYRDDKYVVYERLSSASPAQ